jgi:competence protein ComEA
MTTNAGSRPLVDDRRTSRRRRPARRERWRERQEALAARVGVSPRAVAGVVVVTLLVSGVLGVRLVVAARTGAVAMPVAPAAVGGPGPAGRASVPSVPASQHGAYPPPVQTSAPPIRAGGGGRADPSAAVVGTEGLSVAGSGSTAPAQGQVVVHVVGRVRHPGVVRLPQGSRVEQAVTAAGGARRDADLSGVNLARPLVDGEQVVVPRPGQPAAPAAGTAGPVGASATAAGSGAAGPAQQPVDVNTATLAELDTLPGVGPVLAQRILDWRAQNGKFTSVDELGEVSGIGDAVLARLRPLVRL